MRTTERPVRGIPPRQKTAELAGQPRTRDDGPLEHSRHALFTIELLRRLETAPPPMFETPFDVPAMIFDLEDDAHSLEAAARSLEAARAAVVASRSHLEAVIAETDRILLWSGRCLKKLGRLAEEHRPS